VLDPRHHLRLGLEPTDELRPIGQLRADDLDGDVAIEGGLCGAVHDGERTLTDALAEDVGTDRAFRCLGGALERTGRDLPVEVDQVARRLHADLVDQRVTEGVERAQRLGLPAGVVKGLHLECPWRLAVGVFPCQGLHVGNDVGRPTHLQEQLGPQLS
jgi:hypothetical protein